MRLFACAIVGWLMLSLAAARASAQSAQEVLARVSEVYSHAKALHIVARREEVLTREARSTMAATIEYEIALRGAREYFARSKSAGQESLAVSDGAHTWKALPAKKQWMQVAAAAVESDESEAPDPRSQDLHSSLTRLLAGRYIAIAKMAENPEITGEEDVKIEVSAIEMNSSLADSLFQFEPGKGWSEAEMLLLPGEEHMLLTGSTAANFALKTLGGESVTLNQTRGKVVVLDFWATWCPPCREELPYIEKLREEFAGQVQFFGVNDEESGTVKDFLRKQAYDLTVLMDGKKQVHREYGVSAIPTMFIIDKQGVIREHFIGSRSESKLRQAIQAAVAAN
jgi:peroxiredoxin